MTSTSSSQGDTVAVAGAPPGEPALRGTVSRDGTWIRTWDNGAAGIPVVISNGMGAPPSAWPLLADPDCGFHAVSWYHRGLDASEPPDDPERVTIADHAADLEAVMDAAGMDRAIVIGWSLGVNVAFEAARRDPERVAGILAVGGVAGGSFEILFGPTGLLREWREPAGRVGAWMLRLVGPPLAAAMSVVPPFLDAARGVGAALTGVRPPVAVGALGGVIREFSTHPWTWYSRLVLSGGDHPPMDTAFATFPVTVVSGLLDNLAAADDLRRAAEQLPDARFVPLLGGHFLPLQYPEQLQGELVALAERTDLTAGPTTSSSAGRGR